MRKLISAALIVKDEASHLAACLQSLESLADEIVVVDTGSSDDSCQIAMASGARLFDYRWRDDFSAARNYALDQAEGDWILYIDADERLRRYDRASLEVELSNSLLCACTVRFHPRTGFTAYREHRLFRHESDIRFQGAIHETILPSLDNMVTQHHRVVGASGLTIDHLGYDGDQSRKLERNLKLLVKQLQVDPDRIYLWWHLGVVHLQMGERAEAESAWRRGIEIGRRSLVAGPEASLCFIELAKLFELKGDVARELVDEAASLRPDNLLVEWMRARILVNGERYSEAIPIFERLARIDAHSLVHDVSYDRRIFGAWAEAEIGLCKFRMGLFQDSEKHYRRAEEIEPGCLEFKVKRQLAAARATTALG